MFTAALGTLGAEGGAGGALAQAQAPAPGFFDSYMSALGSMPGGGAPANTGLTGTWGTMSNLASAAQNPYLNAGLVAALGPVGAALGAAGSLFGAALPFMDTGESAAQKAARKKWERSLTPVSQSYNQLFNNPAAEGMLVPQGKGTRIQWAPQESTKAMYSAYLNRNYGVPSGVASAMSSSALAPMKASSLAQAPQTSMGAGAALRALGGAGTVAQGTLGTYAPKLMEEQQRLSAASEIAAYDKWRASQLSGFIG